MDRKYLVGGGLVVAVVALVLLGGAFFLGVGQAPGGDSGGSGDDGGTFPTASTTVAADGTSDGDTASGSPFTFLIDNVEECGTTCRDVTATVTNEQNETATGVTVFTRVFAGENNTNTDDLVWEGSEDIGELEAGASETSTRRVELSLQEARQIDQAGGWITIQTTVQSDDTTVTFVNSEQVS